LNLLLTRSAQLQDKVNDLYGRLVFTDDVVASLEADRSLHTGIRYRAQGIARRKGDKPLRLNRDSWNLVRSPGSGSEARLIGLRGAEAAVTAEPENVVFLNTLGMAQYREAQYENALKTMTYCDELRLQQQRKSVPRNAATLAMVLFELGRIAEARSAFERLEGLIEDSREGWKYNEEAIALFEECQQLLEDSGAQAEPPQIAEDGNKLLRVP
jgi:hypothetical protein